MSSHTGSGPGRVAYFISPHGFGHASRAAAAMAATQELDPAVRFEIFTQVPPWFFEQSLSAPFGYHPLLTDIGLAQKSPLVEDLPGTLRLLRDFIPFDERHIDQVAGRVNQLGCHLVVCDISPLGLAVARAAGIPSMLVENFTWDWIYEGYLAQDDRFRPFIAHLRQVFAQADYHVQTEPVCRPNQTALTTPPVCRQIRTPPLRVRQQLGIPAKAKAVLVTLGGIPWQYPWLDRLAGQTDAYFVIPGVDQTEPLPKGATLGASRLRPLPRKSAYHHPDLVNACDAVIGKVGYSTLAEVVHAGVPFGYIQRPLFRESQVLTAYIQTHHNGLPITEAQLEDGSWLDALEDLLALPRQGQRQVNGATQIARFLSQLLPGHASRPGNPP